MNHRKFQPIRYITKLFNSNKSRSIEQNLKAQIKAESFYTVQPSVRI